MKVKILPLLKSELFNFFINPITYISSFVFLFINVLYFFFYNNFFELGLGSSDIRYLFDFIPVISIIFVPTITMAQWSKEELYYTLPVSSTLVCISKWLASIIIFTCNILLLLLIPFVVSFFGTIEIETVLTGIIGVLLFGAAIISFGLFCSVFFKNQAASFFVTALFLALMNTEFIKSISFSVHFDSFSKGIFNTKDILFFIIITVFFLFSSQYVIELRKYSKGERNKSKKHISLFVSVSVFLMVLLWNTQVFYKRIDITETNRFSLSDISKNIVKTIDSPMTIHYYVSKNFKEINPESRNIEDFLRTYSYENDNILVKISEPTNSTEIKSLENIGVVSQKLPRIDGNSTSIETVYSSVVIEYKNNTEVIPFLFDTTNLEFDVAGRIQSLLGQIQRSAFLLVANGLNLDTDYPFIKPILQSSGFITKELSLNEILTPTNIDTKTPLVVLGSSQLTKEHIEAIDTFVKIGGKVFFSVSPIDINLDTWSASLSENTAIFDYLHYNGIKIIPSLLHDTAILSTQLMNQEGEVSEIEYPFFIDIPSTQFNSESILGQKNKGISVFWASPSIVDSSLIELAHTSENSWQQIENNVLVDQGMDPFITNPFFEQNLKPYDVKTEKYAIASQIGDSMIVVSDQYFLSRATAYVHQVYSMRNFDFLVNSLLKLSGQEELITLKHKNFIDFSLNKIQDEITFNATKTNSMLMLFITYVILLLLPICIILILRRNRGNR